MPPSHNLTSEMNGARLLRARLALSASARCKSIPASPLPPLLLLLAAATPDSDAGTATGCLLPAGGTPSSCRRNAACSTACTTSGSAASCLHVGREGRRSSSHVCPSRAASCTEGRCPQAPTPRHEGQAGAGRARARPGCPGSPTHRRQTRTLPAPRAAARQGSKGGPRRCHC